MKINDFTKSEQLLMFINELEISGNLFSLAEYGDQAIDYGIATSKKNLSSILSNLKNEKWIMNDTNGYWKLTELGMHYVEDKLLIKLDENSWFSVQPKKNKKVEQPNNFANDALQYADIAKDIASKILKQYGVNTGTDEIAKLQKENDKLKHDLHKAIDMIEIERNAKADCAKKYYDSVVIIKNLRRTNRSILEKLDMKTKECEKLQFGLDNIKTTCQNLAVWIDNIKIGQGI